MASKRAILTALLFGPACAVLAIVLTARWSLRLSAPHKVAAPHAVLGRTAAEQLAKAGSQFGDRSVDAAMTEAMRFTGTRLRFGLGHKTSLAFDEHREGNCVEYANLFGHSFNTIAKLWGLSSQAFVVRSLDVTVWGVRLPFPGWRDHDWVAIRTGDSVQFVDPTFGDSFLGADLTGNVHGQVPVPVAGRTQN